MNLTKNDDSVVEALLAKGYIEIADKKCRVKSYDEYISDRKQVSAMILKLNDLIDPLLQPPEPDSKMESWAHIIAN